MTLDYVSTTMKNLTTKVKPRVWYTIDKDRKDREALIRVIKWAIDSGHEYEFSPDYSSFRWLPFDYT